MPFTRLKRKILSLLLVWGLLLFPLPLDAATNSVTGGIGGINNGTLSGGDGTGTGQITINAVDLSLVKQARDLFGNVIPDGSNVNTGQDIYFVLYVDNFTSYSASDIQITDLLDETAFTYIPNSIETALVPTGYNDAAIWAGTWNALTDSVGVPDDVASITDSGGASEVDRLTIGGVSGQVNQIVNISGNSLRAYRFRVTVE